MFQGMALALSRAFQSQIKPSMLALALVPLLIIIAIVALVLGLFWQDLSAALLEGVAGFAPFRWLSAWLTQWGLAWLADQAVNLLLLSLVLVMALLIATVFSAVFVMPIVVRFVQRDYPELSRQGDAPWWHSLTHAGKTLLIFGVVMLVSLPLWLVPPLALLVFWCSMAWLNARLMSYDALAAHATRLELQALLRRHRGRLFLLGLLVVWATLLPFAILIAPVFSALVFAHYNLATLTALRSASLKPTQG